MNSRNLTLLLSLVIILAIAIRIPYIPNETGVDSYLIQWHSQSIIKEKYALWLTHPSAIFGYLEYTYPVFVSFLNAITATFLNISLSRAILIIDFFVAVFGTLSMFIFAKEFSKNNPIAIARG